DLLLHLAHEAGRSVDAGDRRRDLGQQLLIELSHRLRVAERAGAAEVEVCKLDGRQPLSQRGASGNSLGQVGDELLIRDGKIWAGFSRLLECPEKQYLQLFRVEILLPPRASRSKGLRERGASQIGRRHAASKRRKSSPGAHAKRKRGASWVHPRSATSSMARTATPVS